MRVAAVDDYVPVGEQRNQVLDHFVDRRPGLDHHHDLARPLQARHELLDGVTADELLSRAAPRDEVVDDLGRAIENRDLVSAALDVQSQVFAHYGQAH